MPAKKIANRPSTKITMKMRIDHRNRDLTAKRFGRALDPEPLDAGDQPDDQRHEGRLDQADQKSVEADIVLRPHQEGLETDAFVHIGGDHAAAEPRHVGDEGEQRQGKDQRQDARQNQHLDRRHAHHAQGVNLLAHLHRAEFGGDRGARAAGDHDRGQQHAEFAQDQNGDQLDRKGRGAEAPQLIKPLLLDDAADQEIDGHDDRHRPQGEIFHMVDHRRRARERRIEDHPQGRGGQSLRKMPRRPPHCRRSSRSICRAGQENRRPACSCAWPLAPTARRPPRAATGSGPNRGSDIQSPRRPPPFARAPCRSARRRRCRAARRRRSRSPPAPRLAPPRRARRPRFPAPAKPKSSTPRAGRGAGSRRPFRPKRPARRAWNSTFGAHPLSDGRSRGSMGLQLLNTIRKPFTQKQIADGLLVQAEACIGATPWPRPNLAGFLLKSPAFR